MTTMTPTEAVPGGNAVGRRGSGGLWRPIALLALVATALVLATRFDLGSRFGELRAWIEGLGAWGPLVFVALYVLAVVLAIPGSAITLAAGALFGASWGTLLVSIGSTLGAGLSFLIARYFARRATARWLAGNERFRRLDAMSEKHGAMIVALTRLVPLFPFNLLNYGFGLTRIRFGTYLFWSWLCMLPGTVVYVVGADVLARFVADGRVPWPLLVALAGALVLLSIVVRLARRRLRANPDTEETT